MNSTSLVRIEDESEDVMRHPLDEEMGSILGNDLEDRHGRQRLDADVLSRLGDHGDREMRKT